MPITQDRLIAALEAAEEAHDSLRALAREAFAQASAATRGNMSARSEIEYARKSESLIIVKRTLESVLAAHESFLRQYLDFLELIAARTVIPREAEITIVRELEHFKVAKNRNNSARRYWARRREREGRLSASERTERNAHERESTDETLNERPFSAEELERMIRDGEQTGNDLG